MLTFWKKSQNVSFAFLLNFECKNSSCFLNHKSLIISFSTPQPQSNRLLDKLITNGDAEMGQTGAANNLEKLL